VINSRITTYLRSVNLGLASMDESFNSLANYWCPKISQNFTGIKLLLFTIHPETGNGFFQAS
jgi:hypothetical protein